MPNYMIVNGETTVKWVVCMDDYYMYYLVVVGIGIPTQAILDVARAQPDIEAAYCKDIPYAKCKDKIGLYPTNVVTCMVSERISPDRTGEWHKPRIPFNTNYIEHIRPVWCTDDKYR